MSHSCESWRQTRAGLRPLPDKRGEEDETTRKEREDRARRALELDRRRRAQVLGLRLFKVVFKGRGVFVRDGPSLENNAVGCHKLNDEVLVSEERNGWVRVSEEDDDYPYIGEKANNSSGKECWMLIEGSTIGLGRLLEELPVDRVWDTSELQMADQHMAKSSENSWTPKVVKNCW